MNALPRLSLQQKLVFATFLLGASLATGLLLFLNYAQKQTVEVTGINTGRAVSGQIVALRGFYTKEIASRALKAGMTLNHDFRNVEGTLPLPATLVKTLGEKIAQDYPGTQIYLKSRYPFPNRSQETGLDEFQTRALAALEQDPKTPIHQFETYQNRLSIRYAVADIMAEGCVACHNKHPLSPKKDWKVGDVRGMVEVIVPVQEVSNSITHNTWVTVGMTLTGFGVMALLIWILLQKILMQPLADLKLGVDALTKFDLTHTIIGNPRSEIGQLMLELEKIRSQLQNTVRAVRQAGQLVAVNTHEIATENNDLHTRTEQTASTLEETAAAMEQLGTTIGHNANSAKEGSALAHDASQIAIKGKTVVSDVVQTMHLINDSSKQIVDIIGVIDSIAFQTNILALNAAVEAARAGEQGRGFAVVASEVRSLAGRSAEAAKSIKHLISTSVERMQKGSQLVDQAGNTMEQVVTAIERVSHIMTEFSTSSQEQAQGVNQVAQAIGSMDQTTQKNALLVQEMKNASNQLEEQVDHLEQQISIFVTEK